jgi:hypothetical protein
MHAVDRWTANERPAKVTPSDVGPRAAARDARRGNGCTTPPPDDATGHDEDNEKSSIQDLSTATEPGLP